MNNIYLIGMMGSGKSTVGKKLATNLNMHYVDTDSDIESINQMNISEIFQQSGEKKFREMESAYFIEKSKQENQVFSTGGGIILNQRNCRILKSNGITFFLETDCEVLLNRITNISKRPLLNNQNSIEKMSLIWEERKKYYYKSCDHIINTDNLSINDVINEIVRKINEKNSD